MLRGGEIIDQIKCYDDFSKHGLLMNFLHQHMSVSYVGWTKLMAYSFFVFICTLSLSVILCHVHRVYLVFPSVG